MILYPVVIFGKRDLSMDAFLIEHFPEQAEKIHPLLQQDENFVEVCADYQKLALWLVAHERDDRTSETECAANRLLLAELEIEILQFLQAVDDQPSHPA